MEFGHRRDHQYELAVGVRIDGVGNELHASVVLPQGHERQAALCEYGRVAMRMSKGATNKVDAGAPIVPGQVWPTHSKAEFKGKAGAHEKWSIGRFESDRFHH